MNRTRGLFGLLLGLGAISASLTAEAASALDDPGDFAQIAKNGFALTVDHAFYADPQKTVFPNLQPNIGSDRNNWGWSMAWFENSLWVGTNELEPDSDGNYYGAEIWRYFPSHFDTSGDWGLSGKWKRVFKSPRVNPLLAAALAYAGIPNGPRDIGYRYMTVCNAGDGVDRLYVNSFGIPAQVLYWDGHTFKPTSHEGTYTHPKDVVNGSADLGARSGVCFRGHYLMSFAGTPEDVDISHHPAVFMNSDPAHGAPWEVVVDVRGPLPDGTPDPNAHPLADPDNLGIFQLEAVGDRYVYLSTINRTTGSQIWRGDGKDCLEPWMGDGHCNFTWTRIIERGGGRPADLPGITPTIDNAGATLGVFGNDLYVAFAESRYFGRTFAELARIPNAGSPPPGDDESAPHTWQLLVGWARKDYLTNASARGLGNLDCTNPGDMPNDISELSPTAQTFWSYLADLFLPETGDPDLPLLEELDDPGDSANDDCFPATGAGPGFPRGDQKDPFVLGPASYFWRFREHDGDLFIATLDLLGPIIPDNPAGFDLLKTTNGVDYTLVVDDGLGNPNNYGVRGLESVPFGAIWSISRHGPVPHVLALSTTNPFEGSTDPGGSPNGGAEVFIGTTAPGPDAAPRANAGYDQMVLDTGKLGEVTFTLDGSGRDTFGGGGLAADPYRWFRGSLESLGGDCTQLNPADAFSSAADPQDTRASMVGDQTALIYSYVLQVTDQDGHRGCDEVQITASYDLPPTVELHTSVPYGPPDGDGTDTLPVVKMIDFDDDGAETYDVTGLCKDDLAKLVRCELVVTGVPGNTLSKVSDTGTRPGLCTGLGECRVSASVRTPETRANAAAGGQSRPETYLIAVDQAGHEARFRWESLTQRIVNETGNDPPICRNADVLMTAGVDTQIEVDPAAGDRPICVDADGDPMTYLDGGVDPAIGTVAFDGTITYTPNHSSSPAADQLEFVAQDLVPAASGPTTLRVNLVADTAGPEVIVDFPVQGARYLRPGLKAGCGTWAKDVCGSASDSQSQVTAVEGSIQRMADEAWWDGSAFVPGDPVWMPAVGTAAWRLSGFTPSGGGDYRVQARARDTFDNLGLSEPVDFTLSVSLLRQLFAKLFGLWL